MSRARQQEAEAAPIPGEELPQTLPAPAAAHGVDFDEAVPMKESISGGTVTSAIPRNEKKMVMPKRKVSVSIKRPAGSGELVVDAETALAESMGADFSTLDSIAPNGFDDAPEQGKGEAAESK